MRQMNGPSNCFICKNTYTGPGALCPTCLQGVLTHGYHYAGPKAPSQPPPPPPDCSFCGGAHDDADCLAAAVAFASSTMARRRSPHHAFTQYINRTATMPPLKACSKCRGNYLIESKAGSVCSSCHTVVHNPCRNCNSTATKGLSGDSAQFIECQDCLFIE
jgi:hypothetical protein